VTDAIVLENVSKEIRVGFRAVRKELLSGVSFTVPRGSIYGFVGHNGAGKSTTIKHLFGALRPTTGSVRVLGADPLNARARKKFGYLPEVQRLPPTMTALELLRLHSALVGVRPWREVAEALLTKVRLENDGSRQVGEFSKGMQQRLGIALALLGDPELLVLDEPMSGLDPVGRALVRNIILEQHRRGVTVFFSSHILSDVEAICDSLVVIHEGKIVADGTLDELMGKPVGFSLSARWDGELPDAAAALGEWKRRGDAWELHLDGDVMSAARAAEDSGGEVLEMTPVRRSLEDQLLKWFEVKS
jgi:ABC-2 type transport system ATP-binding protein